MAAECAVEADYKDYTSSQVRDRTDLLDHENGQYNARPRFFKPATSQMTELLADLIAGKIGFMTMHWDGWTPELLHDFALRARSYRLSGLNWIHFKLLDAPEAAEFYEGIADFLLSLTSFKYLKCLQFTGNISKCLDAALACMIRYHDCIKLLQCSRTLSLRFAEAGIHPSTSLRSITLSGLSSSMPSDMQRLADWISNGCNLNTLSLAINSIGDPGAIALTEALTPRHSNAPQSHRPVAIRRLILTRCGIGPAGFAAIGKCLGQDPAVECLWLGDNSPGDEGITALGEGLASNCTMRYLSLQGCAIVASQSSQRALAAGIEHCRSLVNLDMAGMRAEDGRFGALADAIGSSSLRKVILSGISRVRSPIPQGSVPRLTDAIQKSLSLQILEVEQLMIANQMVLHLVKSVANSASIRAVKLGHSGGIPPPGGWKSLLPDCSFEGQDPRGPINGMNRTSQLHEQGPKSELLSLEDRRALLPRRTRALRAIQWIEATQAPTPSGPPCCLRASCMLHLLSQGEPIDPDTVGWYACSALQQLGSRMEDVVVLLSSMLDVTEGMGRAEPEPSNWHEDEGVPGEIRDLCIFKIGWAPLHRARVGNGVRGVVGAAWEELAGMDAREGALHCKEDAGAAVPVLDTKRRMAVLRAVVRLGRDLLLRDAKHRQGGMVRWRRAGDARRDAGLVLQAAREGRPLELGQRLVLGALAGGRELLDSALEAARAGGHDECVKVLAGHT